IIRTFFMLSGGIKVEGRENIPKTGPAIIAPNHISFADPPLVGVTLPRYAWFIGTDELFTYPFLGPLARWMRGFPIRQDSADRAAIRKAQDVLSQGDTLVLFPEGHVSKDGVLQPIQAGVMMIAMKSKAPIIPVAIFHTDDVMPPHTWKFRLFRHRVTIIYGKALYPDQISGGLRGREGFDKGADRLKTALEELLAIQP
ncbi:MAG: lysophospholipid acyltransferase family protein, partial [Chthonomonadales bacterium]